MIQRLTSFYSTKLDFTKFGQLTLLLLTPLSSGCLLPTIEILSVTKVLTVTTFNLVHLSGGCAQFSLLKWLLL